MTPYSISREARRDLDEIWFFISKHDLAAADSMLLKLLDVFLHVSRNPLAGELCEELRPGLRRFCVGNYVVYYKAAKRVAIARILHGARDVGLAFAKE
jgi:plasmid stabilization system protein ParE